MKINNHLLKLQKLKKFQFSKLIKIKNLRILFLLNMEFNKTNQKLKTINL